MVSLYLSICHVRRSSMVNCFGAPQWQQGIHDLELMQCSQVCFSGFLYSVKGGIQDKRFQIQPFQVNAFVHLWLVKLGWYRTYTSKRIHNYLLIIHWIYNEEIQEQGYIITGALTNNCRILALSPVIYYIIGRTLPFITFCSCLGFGFQA